jgi:GT2 family glycosyltransferase
LIAETLEALLSIDHRDLEILVIDQSTNFETRQAVEAVAAGNPCVRYWPTPTVGSSAGRNLAAQLSDREVVAYTDDDCIVSDGWLAALAAEFQNPDVSAVYGRLLPWESSERTGAEVGFKAATERVEYSHRTPPWYIGHGGNMAFRRRDLLAAGGFDPLLGAGGFFGACEDPDIAYRMLAAGKTVVYSPNALAYHKHWKDWRAQRRMERAYGIGAGAQFAKYIRCGDSYGLRLLATWIWQLGVRRIGSGLLKWRSTKTVYLGYCQLVYPWVGVWRSFGRSVDRRLLSYVDR